MTLPAAPTKAALLAEIKRRLGDFVVDGWEGRSGDELYQAVARVFSHLGQRARWLFLSAFIRRAVGATRRRLTLTLTWSAPTVDGWTLLKGQILFETDWGARFRLLEDLVRADGAAAGTQTIEVEAEWAGFDYVVAPRTVTRFAVPQTISPTASLVWSSGTTSLGKAEFLSSIGGADRSSTATLTVTNLDEVEAWPETGTTGLLDLIAAGRGLPRELDESDDTLRRRVVSMPDILTPAAILRAVKAAYIAGFAQAFGPGSEADDIELYEYWTYGYAPGVGGIGVHPPARAWSFEVVIPEMPYSGTGYAPGTGAVGVHPVGTTGEPEREGILAALQGLINRIKAPGVWGQLYEGA